MAFARARVPLDDDLFTATLLRKLDRVRRRRLWRQILVAAAVVLNSFSQLRVAELQGLGRSRRAAAAVALRPDVLWYGFLGCLQRAFGHCPGSLGGAGDSMTTGERLVGERDVPACDAPWRAATRRAGVTGSAGSGALVFCTPMK